MSGRSFEVIGQPPIACTLDADGKVERAGDWRRLAKASLLRKARIENGMDLYFQPSAEEAVRSIAALEKQCCAFFDFEFRSTDEAFVLTVTAPPEAEPVLLGLFDPAPSA